MSGIRVISGSAGGLRLKSVPGNKTRPITDRVKEALFNIINNRLEGKIFLDLFAGTGSVGIEALSRGAKEAVFVEKNHQPFQIIRKNLEITNFTNQGHVYKRNAYEFLKNEKDFIFDFIFIAPPQFKKMWISSLMEIDKQPNLMNKGGEIIVQIDKLEIEETNLDNITKNDVRTYGDSLLLFFQYL